MKAARRISWKPGSEIWGSRCWDHWPIGWLNSQGHEVDRESLRHYPNHSTMGRILPVAERDRGKGDLLQPIRGRRRPGSDPLLARRWLGKGTAAIVQPDGVADLPWPAVRAIRRTGVR